MTKLSHYCSITGIMLLLFFKSTGTSAQGFNYVAASQNMMRTQFASMQMQMMNMNMMNMMRWNYKDNMFTNNKLTFALVMKDSVTKEIKSKIYIDTFQRKTYIVAVDKSFREGDARREKRIYPADAKGISITRGTYEGTFEPKLTTDSCWMFRVIDGQINVYSNALAIVAIQKGDAPLQPFSKANLQAMVQDDPKAVKFFDKKDYLKAINKYNNNHPKPEEQASNGGNSN